MSSVVVLRPILMPRYLEDSSRFSSGVISLHLVFWKIVLSSSLQGLLQRMCVLFLLTLHPDASPNCSKRSAMFLMLFWILCKCMQVSSAYAFVEVSLKFLSLQISGSSARINRRGGTSITLFDTGGYFGMFIVFTIEEEVVFDLM